MFRHRGQQASHPRFPTWFIGYTNKVYPLRNLEQLEIIHEVDVTQSLDGSVLTVKAKCPDCHCIGEPCVQCGGANRHKARILVAKQPRMIRRPRLNFQLQVARRLVDRYDLLVIEDLDVAGLIKNHCLARSISDVGWSGSADILAGKVAYAGQRVIRVNPAYTSQVCSGCGCLVRKELSERWHSCPDCGLSLHRDVNAARNILKAAETLPLGGNVEELDSCVAQEAH